MTAVVDATADVGVTASAAPAGDASRDAGHARTDDEGTDGARRDRPRRRRRSGTSTTVLLTDAGPVAVDDATADPRG